MLQQMRVNKENFIYLISGVFSCTTSMNQKLNFRHTENNGSRKLSQSCVKFVVFCLAK